MKLFIYPDFCILVDKSWDVVLQTLRSREIVYLYSRRGEKRLPRKIKKHFKKILNLTKPWKNLSRQMQPLPG